MVNQSLPNLEFHTHGRTTHVFVDQDDHLEEEVGNEETQQAEHGNNRHRNASGTGSFCRESILCSALLSASRHIPLSQARSRLFL